MNLFIIGFLLIFITFGFYKISKYIFHKINKLIYFMKMGLNLKQSLYATIKFKRKYEEDFILEKVDDVLIVSSFFVYDVIYGLSYCEACIFEKGKMPKYYGFEIFQTKIPSKMMDDDAINIRNGAIYDRKENNFIKLSFYYDRGDYYGPLQKEQGVYTLSNKWFYIRNFSFKLIDDFHNVDTDIFGSSCVIDKKYIEEINDVPNEKFSLVICDHKIYPYLQDEYNLDKLTNEKISKLFKNDEKFKKQMKRYDTLMHLEVNL